MCDEPIRVVNNVPGYNIPMSVFVALFLTISLKLPDSNTSSTKRQVRLFLYIDLHPRQTSPRAGLRYEDVAKLRRKIDVSK